MRNVRSVICVASHFLNCHSEDSFLRDFDTFSFDVSRGDRAPLRVLWNDAGKQSRLFTDPSMTPACAVVDAPVDKRMSPW